MEQLLQIYKTQTKHLKDENYANVIPESNNIINELQILDGN